MAEYYRQFGEAAGAAMAHNARMAAELAVSRAERATAATPEPAMPDTPPPRPEEQADRCPRCWCSDCGGRLDQHRAAGCDCEDCQLDPKYACSLGEFVPPERISILAQQLGPLLSAHLGPNQQQRRCLAVAHAAHHALLDYDHPGDPR
jgi:hypothetical protein